MNTEPKLRIACAVVKYFEFGGMQRTYRRIVEELNRRGHEVFAIAHEWQGPKFDGVEHVMLPAPASTNHGRNAAFAESIRRWRQDNQVDVLVGFNKFPGLDIYYAGDVCFAYQADERAHAMLHKMLPRFRGMKGLEKSVFEWGRDTKILMISPTEKSRFQMHYDTEDERFHLLPPGIDKGRLDRQLTKRSDRDTFISSIGLDPKDRMIVMVGSGFHTKGVDRVLRSVAALPPSLDAFCSIAVVGAGDDAKYKKMARRLGIEARCVFLGPRNDVVEFYRHADLLAHPARIENTGTTIIEAMYCGLPVLTTANCGFAHHVIQAQAGIVCPLPFDEKIFDGLLLGALMAPQRESWRANGVSYCQQADLYSLIEKAADIICQPG